MYIQKVKKSDFLLLFLFFYFLPLQDLFERDGCGPRLFGWLLLVGPSPLSKWPALAFFLCCVIAGPFKLCKLVLNSAPIGCSTGRASE